MIPLGRFAKRGRMEHDVATIARDIMLNEQFFHHRGLNLSFATGPRNGPALVFFHGVTRR